MDIILNFFALLISHVAVKHAIWYPTHCLSNKQPPNIHNITPAAIQKKGMESEEDEDLLLPDVAPFEESPLELICPHCDAKVFTTVTVSFRRWVGLNKNHLHTLNDLPYGSLKLSRFGFFVGHCCVVPCCVSVRYEHSCPLCKRTVGIGSCDDWNLHEIVLNIMCGTLWNDLSQQEYILQNDQT